MFLLWYITSLVPEFIFKYAHVHVFINQQVIFFIVTNSKDTKFVDIDPKILFIT